MKKTAIWASLFTLISSSQLVFADSQPVVEQPAPAQATDAAASTVPAAPTTAPAPVSQQLPAKLDCNYHIPADQKTIDQPLIMKWAQNAAIQTFSFDHSQLDNQMKALENCFTKAGWQSYNDAIKKSGNLNVIKSDKLTVSASVQGQPQLIDHSDNEWKLNFPMTVIYQNDQEKISQNLDIGVVVGRKISGDLGIMQLIAKPQRQMNPNQNSNTPSDNTAQTDNKQNQ